MIEYYIFVFVSSLLVDLVPFIGPPAWTVMVFFQMKFGLNIWGVLALGVSGSTLGRYLYSLYIPVVSAKFIKTQKQEDIEFIGTKLSGDGWRIQLFVLLYTLLPLPSTPLFTASGMARIKPLHIIPAFMVGKFTSDMIMVLTGDYAARNAVSMARGFWSLQSILGAVSGIIIILIFFCIDWRLLLQHKKFRLSFHIWK